MPYEGGRWKNTFDLNKKTETHKIGFLFFGWAGGIRTHEMQESKSCALPLGDSPINDIEKRLLSSLKAFFMGWVVRVELTTSRATIWRPNQLGHTHHMARQERLELPTYCLEGSCSIQLSYWRIFMERVMGIEPTRPAWKAGILPLNYTRMTLSR